MSSNNAEQLASDATESDGEGQAVVPDFVDLKEAETKTFADGPGAVSVSLVGPRPGSGVPVEAELSVCPPREGEAATKLSPNGTTHANFVLNSGERLEGEHVLGRTLMRFAVT